MRILLVTDAWLPQINGVVRTLGTLKDYLSRLGHETILLTPDGYAGMACPSYPEIRLAFPPAGAIGRLIDRTAPDTVHIATEGPLGLRARGACIKRGLAFTTAYHTRFPEYVEARWRVPVGWSYRFLRWFHRPAARTMVATETMETVLAERGFGPLCHWSRGVDTDLFRPRNGAAPLNVPRPLMLYVGRVAVEKNLEAFLSLDRPGTKVVVGDGPQRAELTARFPGAKFLGAKQDEELAALYSAADVFVFPSLTDTFGLVLLEALASGVPVAAMPAAGPLDVIGGSGVGVIDSDLGAAIDAALTINRAACVDFARRFSWEASARQFLANLAPLNLQAVSAAR